MFTTFFGHDMNDASQDHPAETFAAAVNASLQTSRTNAHQPDNSRHNRRHQKQGAWSAISIRPKHVKWLMNIWGPFVGARIHVEHIADDFRFVRVRMKQSWYNSNYVGVHFGGSLYAMTDPFYMLMLLHNLNNSAAKRDKHYIVWDKASSITFKKPAKGYVYAEFRLTQEQIDTIKEQADTLGKVEPQLSVDILNKYGDIVAVAHKTLYVRNIRTA
jgi:hypothetical protein